MAVQNRSFPLPFLVTTEMPCPYLPGKLERKVVTELAGPTAAILGPSRVAERRKKASTPLRLVKITQS